MELKERLLELAEESGYEVEELVELWGDYCQERREDNEPIDWEYFKGVTMEHDW